MTVGRPEEGEKIDTPALSIGTAAESPEIWLEVRPLVPAERAARFIAFLLRASPGAELRLGGHEAGRYRFHVAAPASAIIAALLDTTEFVPVSLRQPALDELQVTFESVPGGPDGERAARPDVDVHEESPPPPQEAVEWQPTWRAGNASPTAEIADPGEATEAETDAATELLPPLVGALERLDLAIGELYDQLSADATTTLPAAAEPVDAHEPVEDGPEPPLYQPVNPGPEDAAEQARNLGPALTTEEEPEEFEEPEVGAEASSGEPEPEAATLVETGAAAEASSGEPEPEAATLVETVVAAEAIPSEPEPEAATLVERAAASLSSVFASDAPRTEEAEPEEAEERYYIVLGDSCPVCRAVSRMSFSAARPPQLPIAGCRETGGCRCTLPQFDVASSRPPSAETTRASGGQDGDAATEFEAEDDGKPLAFRGQIQIVAHPFANFGRLNQFITVVGGLPGVRTVTLRRFRNGILRLAVDYTGATPLSTHLKLALGESVGILSDSGELIEITVPEQEQDQERRIELMTVAARGSKANRPASA